MKTLQKTFLVFSFFILFIFSFYFLGNSLNYKEDVFTITEGETLKTISQKLKEEGFVKNSNLFYLSLYLTQDPKEIKAGSYQLNSKMGNLEIIDKIIKGNTLVEKITIIEGWTIAEIGKHLEKEGLFEAEQFLETTNSNNFLEEFEFLKYKPEGLSLEGFLFPDTYYFNKNDSPETVVRKMLSNFEEKVWPEIKEKETFYNTLILASLLEKEVITFEDKQKVADILLKRLEAGMALQVDATVLYANNLESLDLEIDSPYNTYKYPGFPLGPISNPGLESIKAALNPLKNNYWYYLSTKNGTTIFSRNFEEHKMNKNIYLK